MFPQEALRMLFLGTGDVGRCAGGCCAREVGARCADVFAGAKGVCLRQGVSRSEV